MTTQKMGDSDQRKHRSIGERLKRAKSTESKRKTAMDWAANWAADQKQALATLKGAVASGNRRSLDFALGELSAITEKSLGALPRVIDLLLEGVEDDPED